MCNDAQLDMGVIGPHFSSNLISVGFAFSVEVLISCWIAKWVHHGYPEVVGVGSDSVEGLFKGDFYFESESTELNDFNGLY